MRALSREYLRAARMAHRIDGRALFIPKERGRRAVPGVKPALKELVDLGLAKVATVERSWHGGWDAHRADAADGTEVHCLVRDVFDREWKTGYEVCLTEQGYDAATALS